MAISKIFKPGKGVDIPVGSQIAIVQSIIHLGTQRTEYEGNVSYKDQILFTFELPEFVLENGHSVTLSKTETNTSGIKGNLTKLLTAINGGKKLTDDGLDLEDAIGKPLMLTVGVTKTGNSKIEGYTSIHDNLKKTLKPLIGTPRLLLDVEEISAKELSELPEWVQKIINERIDTTGNDVDPDVDY